MKIGMIIYSQTGNTWSVAQKIKSKLESKGHDVEQERIELEREVENPMNLDSIKFKNIPNPEKYDHLILGASVQAFALCPAMKAYMKKVKSFRGCKIALLVTQGFWFPCLGGNKAVKWLTKDCESKGGEIIGSGIVNWMRKDREEQIKEVVEKISGLF